MVVKRLMRIWRPWPPSASSSTPFTVHISVLRLEGNIAAMLEGHGGSDRDLCVWVELRHKKKGSGGHGIMHFGRNNGHKKSFSTSPKRFPRASDAGGVIAWDEEEEEAFESRCVLLNSAAAEAAAGGFLPYHVYFAVIVQIGSRAKATTVGTSVMDLGELAPSSDKSIVVERTTTTTKKKLQLFPPHAESTPSKSIATLEVSIAFSEGEAQHDNNGSPGGSDHFMAHPLRCLSGPLVCVDQQMLRESYGRKIKAAKRSVSLNWRRASISGELDADFYKSRNGGPTTTTTSNGALDPDTCSDSSEDAEAHDAGGGDEEGRASTSSSSQQQRYCNLSSIRLAENVGVAVESMRAVEDRSREAGSGEESESSLSDVDGGSVMGGLLPWRRKKRKLGFRSPPKRGKPLLNKGYGEDGGDDIDRDRRLSGCPAGAILPIEDEGRKASSASVDFGEEDGFSVGRWEAREVVSRDGRARLRANVFFASIDQRSERAGGESACAALVAVIADWLHRNPGQTPNRAEFDTLIREGSDEWRKLSVVDRYKHEFPDLHFDLDTVLAARVRDVAVRHDRSFVGFFALDAHFPGFFDTVLSFDDVWEAIDAKKPSSASEPAIYIVSWNDHFFVFTVSDDACYIIDTLGERLYEGCDEAYIVRFDADATLAVHAPVDITGQTESSGSAVPPPPEPSPDDDGKANGTHVQQADGDQDRPDLGPEQALELRSDPQSDDRSGEDQQELVEAAKTAVPSPPTLEEEHRGKDACKHFLKRFFASVPLAELEADVRRGLVDSLPLHKLQIDFHYTSRGG